MKKVLQGVQGGGKAAAYMGKTCNIARFGKSVGGFTLIEIIAALMIVAILAAVAVSKIPSTQSYEADSEIDILKTNLRYAQLRALSDDKPWGISFKSEGGIWQYTLLREPPNTAPYNLPNENSPTHILPSGITIAGAAVTFDEWGSPGAGDITITLTPGSTITVTKHTGFIP